MLIHESYIDLELKDTSSASSTMRAHIFTPQGITDGAKLGGICVFTEIYQVTGPVRRLCRRLASNGYIVASPESYHEFEVPGTVLAYDEVGTEKGNNYKISKPIQGFDADAAAVVDYLKNLPYCNGRIASLGMCLGGHLALRCAMLPDVKVGICLFPTDVQQGSLGSGSGDDTLQRMGTLGDAELVMVWGKQDHHVPLEGRAKIKARLDQLGVDYSWFEVNARHAFIRDELSKGRYDAALTSVIMTAADEALHRRIVLGLPSQANVQPQIDAPGPRQC